MPLKPPYLRWYDKNAYYDFRLGVQGHSTENCKALKYSVQALIKGGYLNFSDEPNPNMIDNLFPNHVEPKVNAITKEQSRKIKTNVEKMKTPMKVIYKVLVKAAFLELGRKEQYQKEMPRHFCEYHNTAMGYTIQCCKEFRVVVQTMMDQGKIEFYEEDDKERYRSAMCPCPRDHEMNN